MNCAVTGVRMGSFVPHPRLTPHFAPYFRTINMHIGCFWGKKMFKISHSWTSIERTNVTDHNKGVNVFTISFLLYAWRRATRCRTWLPWPHVTVSALVRDDNKVCTTFEKVWSWSTYRVADECRSVEVTFYIQWHNLDMIEPELIDYLIFHIRRENLYDAVNTGFPETQSK